jgi:hypothetical protein
MDVVTRKIPTQRMRSGFSLFRATGCWTFSEFRFDGYVAAAFVLVSVLVVSTTDVLLPRPLKR